VKLRRWHKISIAAAVVAGGLVLTGWIIYGGGRHEGPGTVHPAPLPAEAVAARAAAQRAVTDRFPADQRPSDQILFGDLHVHTTFSADAFMLSLPFLHGEGAHPPADACDYARYCSSLDFFALTDHAETMTPRHWRESVDTIRQCNAAAGDPASPDLVAYMGFEWSQVGPTPEEHYGHKNVIFPGLGDDELPRRPIGSSGVAAVALRGDVGISKLTMLSIPIRDFSHRQRYLDLRVFQREVLGVDECPAGVDTRELPADCREVAPDPTVLFEKLNQWGFDAMVIPHGTTWGMYTPPGYTWDKQLHRPVHDPDRQRLIEVYSGHGNSEEFRDYTAVLPGAEGAAACPAPSKGYEPCCWRAGELVRERCGDISAEACEKRVLDARAAYVGAGAAGHITVPWATMEDWRGCGQCRDCFLPSFSSRPRGSVQYILARGGFDDNQWGFIASSDNHTARPGTGSKEQFRRRITEATGPRSQAWRDRIFGAPPGGVEAHAYSRDEILKMPPFRIAHLERQASFFLTGGLVAVHASGRDRASIWAALERREVYGTSGERILLWFDLLDGATGTVPMGGLTTVTQAPRFRVRAAGSLVQLPGCPEWNQHEVGADRLERLCGGECYNPGNQRHRITRIEVVRIRPGGADGVAARIEDPWRVLDCPADPAGCTVEFEDGDAVAAARDTSYYVRAIQEPTPAINGGGLRCADADCSVLEPCYGDWRTPYDDDCLTPVEERAWSSPIYVRFAAPAAPAPAGADPGAPPAGGGR